MQLTGKKNPGTEGTTPTPSGSPATATLTEGNPDVEENPAITPVLTDVEEENFSFSEGMNDIAFTKNGYFYTEDITLKVFSRKGGTIYYSLDGKNPLTDGKEYNPAEGIVMTSTLGTQPRVYPLSVAAKYDGGTDSGVFVHAYFIGARVSDRYSTYVFNIVGDPDQLDNGPDGIFYGENYKDRGMSSERPIHLEVIDTTGKPLLSQFAGIRIYGGYSRQNWQKSMKLFARSTYDSTYSSFRLSCLDELRLDGTGTQILNFDKFVLRDSGNDYQFAFVRDELNQMLTKRAGYMDYEPVLPAVCYRNGNYVGFFWLHASYCNDFFTDRFGKNPSLAEDAEQTGHFVTLEGGEKFKKSDDEDEEVTALADQYEDTYEDFIDRDAANDDVYRELCEWMDVENYLDYYALNIYLNNKDWPNNNYKCYRYFPGDGEKLTANTVYDGRWRYLPHDIDYTMGLYEQTETLATYDTLKTVMSSAGDRNAPLFTQLMQRTDCREYFVKKIMDLGNGAFSPESIISTLREINNGREKEMEYYYNFLMSSMDGSVWTRPEHFQGYTEIIYSFAKSRPARNASYVKSRFELGSTYNLNITNSADVKLQLNSFTTDAGKNFSGMYFPDYDTEVSAICPVGTEVDYWEVNGAKVNGTKLTIKATDVTEEGVNVVLHTKETSELPLFISIIAARDSDYLVLQNRSAAAISLDGYTLTVKDLTVELPKGKNLAAGVSLTVYGSNVEGGLPADAVTMEGQLSTGEVITLSAGGTVVNTITLPKTHAGFVMKYDLYSRSYVETKVTE